MEDKHRYIGLVVAVLVIVAAILYDPSWWNDFQ